MADIHSYGLSHIQNEVAKICNPFLECCGIPYFQFKRIYKDNSFIILANDKRLFNDFLGRPPVESILYRTNYIGQSNFYFWDELVSPKILELTTEKMGIYHSLTITMRGKTYFDSASFAMSRPHNSPTSYYLRRIKNFQSFSENFPKRAQYLIKKLGHAHRQKLVLRHNIVPGEIFLPRRSKRLQIGKGSNEYITTYEALCVELLQGGKSYKEIGALLSMSTGTVETHLDRLKRRTGLSYQEVSLYMLRAQNKQKT